MTYVLKNGGSLEILHKNRRSTARVCCGWGKLLLSAIMSIPPTRESISLSLLADSVSDLLLLIRNEDNFGLGKGQEIQIL